MHVRERACARLRGCRSGILIQRKGAARDTGSRKKSPERWRTGDVRVCLLQRERREREKEGKALRNIEVVQESWARAERRDAVLCSRDKPAFFFFLEQLESK